jgi:hypothetical protein
MSASVQARPSTRFAGLTTTQLSNASAGAIFQAGTAIRKFHGVIIPITHGFTRHVDCYCRPDKSHQIASLLGDLATEEFKDMPRARCLATIGGQRFTFFSVQLVFAGQNL